MVQDDDDDDDDDDDVHDDNDDDDNAEDDDDGDENDGGDNDEDDKEAEDKGEEDAKVTEERKKSRFFQLDLNLIELGCILKKVGLTISQIFIALDFTSALTLNLNTEKKKEKKF